MGAVTYSALRKANPYHGPDGKFTSKGGGGGASMKYTEEQQDAAIAAWSDGAYGKIRAAQTGKTNDPESVAQAEAIEEFIENAPKYTGELYRGIATDEPLDFKNGQVIDMRGLSSWTTSEDMAEEFASWGAENKYFFVTEGLSMAADISQKTMNPGEGEVLVSGKAKFKIKSMEWEPDSAETIIVLEEER